MTTTGIERIAKRARSQPTSEFTTLMHHYTVENLRTCFEVLDGKKALGVDGVSKAESGGQPAGTVPKTASDVVPPSSRTTSGDSQRGWHSASFRDQLPGRQNRSGDDPTDSRSDLRACVYRDLLWIPPKAELSRRIETTKQRGNDQTRQLDRRHRPGSVLRHDASPGDPDRDARADQG